MVSDQYRFGPPRAIQSCTPFPSVLFGDAAGHQCLDDDRLIIEVPTHRKARLQRLIGRSPVTAGNVEPCPHRHDVPDHADVVQLRKKCV